MKYLFSASEIGSAKSLIPIINILEEEGNKFRVHNLGYFKDNPNSNWNLVNLNHGDRTELKNQIISLGIDCLIFSVNVFDEAPLVLARICYELNIKTIHILDYWNGYTKRLELDGKSRLQPTIYAVPDELAKEASILEGINKHSIKVIGHPDFYSSRKRWKRDLRNKEEIFNKYKISNDKKLISFISEPVAEDSNIENNFYTSRGYNQYSILKHFIKDLDSFKNQFELVIIPHPRENKTRLESKCKEIETGINFSILDNKNAKELLPYSLGIAGMASTLLHEAWMMGFPILSIQFDLEVSALRAISKRRGVLFVEDKKLLRNTVIKWINKCIKIDSEGLIPKADLLLHENSSREIKKILKI